jgi:hypothetical protein
MEDSLLPECAQGKEEAETQSKRRKRNSDSDDGSSISKREATEKCRPLPVYQKSRPVVTKNLFAPLRPVHMEGAEVCDETPSSENSLEKGRPTPIVLTSEIISFQKDLKAVVTGEFFRNTASGTRITTKIMADYKTIQNVLSKKGLPFFIFYTKGDNLVKAVIRHLPNNFPLFLITLVRNQKSLDIFKISSLCNIIVKVEVYKSESGLTQCYNCQLFGHIWVKCRQPARCMWCGGGHRYRECSEKENTQSFPSCCNCNLKDGQLPHPTNYRDCSYAKEELQRRKKQRISNQGS